MYKFLNITKNIYKTNQVINIPKSSFFIKSFSTTNINTIIENKNIDSNKNINSNKNKKEKEEYNDDDDDDDYLDSEEEINEKQEEEKEEEKEEKEDNPYKHIKQHQFPKKTRKRLNDRTKWLQWFCGMVDCLDGKIRVNKVENCVDIEISQKEGDNKSFLDMKINFGAGRFTAESIQQPKKGIDIVPCYKLNGVNQILVRMLNMGSLRNSKSQEEFKECCELFGLDFKNPQPLYSNNGWVVGVYEAIGQVQLNTDNLSITLIFEHPSEFLINQLQLALGGQVTFDKDSNLYRLESFKSKDKLEAMENFLMYFHRKSIKLKKAFKLSITPPFEPKLKIKDPNDINKIRQDRKLAIWKHFLSIYNEVTKADRVELINYNARIRREKLKLSKELKEAIKLENKKNNKYEKKEKKSNKLEYNNNNNNDNDNNSNNGKNKKNHYNDKKNKRDDKIVKKDK